MDLKEAMSARHTVRKFAPGSLSDAEVQSLNERVDKMNSELGLEIKLVRSDEAGLNSFAKLFMSSGGSDYFVLAADEAPDAEEAALLAPTALNRQKFMLVGEGNKVTLSYAPGPMSGSDKGIVKHHFELGAGKENFEWA